MHKSVNFGIYDQEPTFKELKVITYDQLKNGISKGNIVELNKNIV